MAKLIYYFNLIPEWLGWCMVGILATVAVALIAHIIYIICREWKQ